MCALVTGVQTCALPILPVDRAVLVEIVDDGQARCLPFLQPDERRGHCAVDPDRAADLAVDAHRLPGDAQRYVIAGYGRKRRGDDGRHRLGPGREPCGHRRSSPSTQSSTDEPTPFHLRSEEHTSELQSLMRIS